MSFSHSKEIQQLLEKEKPFTSSSYAEVNRLISNNPTIHLYRMATFTKVLFVVTRYQVYFYCAGMLLRNNISQGLSGYTLYSIYEKWNNSDRKKLAIAGGVALTSSLLGFLFTLRLGKLLPTNIFYNCQKEIFEISYYNWYCGRKLKYFTIDQFKVNQKRIGLINSTVQYKVDGEKLCTKGPGSWSNIGFVDYLLKTQ